MPAPTRPNQDPPSLISYRLYTMNRDGHIVDVRPFRASGDLAAMVTVAPQAGELRELWSGDRRIAEFPAVGDDDTGQTSQPGRTFVIRRPGTSSTTPETMSQIGYFSTATDSQDARAVHDILRHARGANARDCITGLLVAGAGRYLQVIEGPEAPVEALYGRIMSDQRHTAVAGFLSRKTAERSFGSWSMAYRRQTALGVPNSFSAVLGALTSEIVDAELKHQIRYFVGAAMT